MTIRFLSPIAAAYDVTRVQSDQTMMAEFFTQSAQAIDGEGRPVHVRDNGSGASLRYTWERTLPDGSDTLTQLVWNDTLGEWEAGESPRNTFNNYPWFVLTRDDDADQVVEAIEYFLANRDSHGNTDFAGQPFRVTGGVRYPRTYQDFDSRSERSPMSGPRAARRRGGGPSWPPTVTGRRAIGSGIAPRNEARFNVRIAVHTTDAPAAGRLGSSLRKRAPSGRSTCRCSLSPAAFQSGWTRTIEWSLYFEGEDQVPRSRRTAF